MKRLLASLALITAAAVLSGCYYDPGYRYVRHSGYGGDAYYGQGDGAYYAAPGYYDGYYGGGYYDNGYYGCCYAPGVSVGISSGWYGGSRDHGYQDYRGSRDYRGSGYRGGHDDHRSDYRGHGGNYGGDRRGNADGGRASSGARAPRAERAVSHHGGNDRRGDRRDHRN